MKWLYAGLPLIVLFLIAIYMLRRLPQHVIPFNLWTIVGLVVFVLAAYIAIKGIAYLFASWKVEESEPIP